MSAATKANFQPDPDVHITFEDQSRINVFARLNAKSEDLKDELKNKENELRNIEDAEEELSLMDESDQVGMLIGEVFIYQDIENTLKSLADQKVKTQNDMAQLKKAHQDIQTQMSDLKTVLYAKFRSHINLEPDDD